MSQRSSQEITAQIKKLKQERTLMKLLEEKFPRERKSRFEKLPYDCMEKIYEYLHPAGLSRYRLAKALHKESIHYDISLKCLSENLFKVKLDKDCYKKLSRKRVEKLSNKLAVSEEEQNKMFRHALKMRDNKNLEEIKKIEGGKGDGKDNIIVCDLSNIGFIHQIERLEKNVLKYGGTTILRLKAFYTEIREAESGKDEIEPDYDHLCDYTENISPLTESDQVIRIIKDSEGVDWAFVKRAIYLDRENKCYKEFKDSMGRYSDMDFGLKVAVKRLN